MYGLVVRDMMNSLLLTFQISTNALAILVKTEVPVLISTIATRANVLLDSLESIVKDPNSICCCIE